MLDRRNFGWLSMVSATCCVASGPRSLMSSPIPKDKLGSGFSLYGMKSLPLQKAIETCAEIGYDCIEIPTMVDWPGAPEKLNKEDRNNIQRGMRNRSLRLSALMENLILLAEPVVHSKNRDRLKSAYELSKDLSPQTKPIVETVLGGKPSEWDQIKSQMADRLGEWSADAEKAGAIVAIKAHISGAAHRPEHVRWLLDQVKSPSLKSAFDFSHFQLRGIELQSAWSLLAKDVVFIHIKDSIGDEKKFQFVLPGEGSIDYAEYFKLCLLYTSPSPRD